MQEYGNGRRGIGQWNKFKFRLRGIHISHLSYIYVNLQLLIDHFMQRMTADKDVQIYASKAICIIIMLSIFLSNFTGGDHLLNNRKNCLDMAVVTSLLLGDILVFFFIHQKNCIKETLQK